MACSFPSVRRVVVRHAAAAFLMLFSSFITAPSTPVSSAVRRAGIAGRRAEGEV